MLDDALYGIEEHKRKRKQDRRRPLNQWLQYDDFSEFEPQRKKRTNQPDYDHEYRDYLPRDPKRMLRKSSARKDKGTEKRWGF